MPPVDALDPFSSPTFIKWLLGQSIAFVTVLLGSVAWIRYLIGQVKYERLKNEELSSLYLRASERALLQRAKDIDDFALRQDSNQRNLLEFFKGIAERPSITEHSIARKSPTKLSEHRAKKERVKPPSESAKDEDEPTPPG